jgi:outer membrane receptor protein involved in Fe transport
MIHRFTTRKYKSIILFFILFTSTTNLAIAQSDYIIRGQVFNNDGKPIVSATVLLQKIWDSSVLKILQTNDSGKYSINLDSIDNTQIKVLALGYLSSIKFIPSQTHYPVVNFILSKEKYLEEVTVTSRKPVFEEKVDRTVFNVENSTAALGGNALDALKRTPGVQILNSEVSIAGKGSVSIMINGRLQQLSGNDLIQFLQSIPSDNLAKIEVITAPPAKYDAEGNSGIINLIMKKNLKQGFNGSVTTSYQYTVLGSPAVSASFNYRKEKLNIFCNANTGIFAWRYSNRTSTYNLGQMGAQNINTNSFNKNATFQLSADYSLSKRSLIGLQFTEGINKLSNYENVRATYCDASGNLDSIIYTNGTTRESNKGKHTLNLNYEWKIDTSGRKLYANADYYSQTAQKSRSYNVHDYIPGNVPSTGIENMFVANPAITIKSVKADIEWPMKKTKILFGGKVAVVENSADNIFNIFDGTNFVIDSTQTNSFSYKEQTQAVYISGQKAVGKYELQLGLRGERTQTDIDSKTTGQNKRNEYTQIFPSGYLQYKFNDNNVLSMTFTRRISRPGYSLLNPFRLYYSPNYYVVGNPDLKPSFNNNLDFTYRWRSKLSLKIFARQVDNYWDHIIQTDPVSGITSLTRANIGFARHLGMNFSYQFDLKKWWQSRNSVNAVYNHFNLHYYNQRNTFSGFNEWFETGNSFYLNKNKTISAELEAYYYTPRQKDYKKWAELSSINIGIKILLLDKNLIIVLNLEDLMAKGYWLQTNVYNGSIAYSYDNARGGRLSVTYKFGNKNLKGRRDRNISNEEIQRVN